MFGYTWHCNCHFLRGHEYQYMRSYKPFTLFIVKDPHQLSIHVSWCLEYADLHRAAIRRLTTRRDIAFGGSRGQQYMQVALNTLRSTRKDRAMNRQWIASWLVSDVVYCWELWHLIPLVLYAPISFSTTICQGRQLWSIVFTYLQACYDGVVKYSTFMSGPLLAELAAIKLVLTSSTSTPHGASLNGSSLTSTIGYSHQARSIMTEYQHEVDEEVPSDFCCAICLVRFKLLTILSNVIGAMAVRWMTFRSRQHDA